MLNRNHDRVLPAVRAAGFGLAILGLLAASAASAGSVGAFGLQFKLDVGARKSGLAGRLAAEVQAVKGRFDASRRALPTVPGPNGAPVYPRAAVGQLIDATEGDLDGAIARLGEPGLAALRRWEAEQFRQIRTGLEEPPGARTAALLGPRAVAVVASLGGSPPPADAGTAAPGAAEAATQALERVARVVERLFVLAKNDDLTVDLWVGSTPAQRAVFRFWSQGFVKGTAPAPTIVQTNGKQKRVFRGLYSYSAELAGAPAIEYPPSGGAASPARLDDPRGAAGAGTERLDLVDGSSFFCCRFEAKYCLHVDSAKDCRPDGR